MKKTVIIHDVPAEDVAQVEGDLQSEGYNTASYLEPDGEYTVIGTKKN